jgi:hypothetical protein
VLDMRVAESAELALHRHRTVVCVPKTSSPSCDQAVLVDQACGVGLPSDAVPVEINRFG